MTQPAARNPRARRIKPTRQLSSWIDEGLWTRMGKHVEERGLVRAKFLERAIAAQLEREQAMPPGSES